MLSYGAMNILFASKPVAYQWIYVFETRNFLRAVGVIDCNDLIVKKSQLSNYEFEKSMEMALAFQKSELSQNAK